MDGIQWYDLGSCRNSNLRNCKLTQKQLQGFNGTQTQGVSVRASVLCQLSYEDPYIETLKLGALALSSTSVCNKINLSMSCVLPAQSKVALQQVHGVTRGRDACAILSNHKFVFTQPNNLIRLRDRFEHEWNNAQHRFSTRFVAMLKIKLHIFAAHFTLALLNVKCIIWMKSHMLVIDRKGKERKISPTVYSNCSYSSVTRWF